VWSLLSFEAQAQAQPASVRLKVESTAIGCPDAEAIKAGVSARLGRRPFAPDVSNAAKDISVKVHQKGDGLAAEISVIEGGKVRGQRSIESASSDCGELTLAMELAIAIAIDPMHVGAPAPVAPAPAPPPAPGEELLSPYEAPLAPPLPPPRAFDVQSAPLPPRRDPSSRLLALGPLFAVGSQPGAALGLAAQLHFDRGSVLFGIEGRIDLPSEVEVGPGRVVGTTLRTSGLLCGHRSIFDLCAVASFGVLQARGEGYSEDRSATLPYFAAGGRLGLRLPLSDRLSALAFAQLDLPLARSVLLIDEMTAWKSSPIATALTAQIGWTL
jgi:hypothetical protein